MEGKWVELKEQKGVYGYILGVPTGYNVYNVRVFQHGRYTDKKLSRSMVHIVNKPTLSKADRKILLDQQINWALDAGDDIWLRELAEELEGSK